MTFSKDGKMVKQKKSKCISCSSCLFKHLGICVFNKKKCDIKSSQPAPFQRITLGEYKITYLPDGEGYTIPTFAYHGSTEEDWKKYKKYLNKEGKSLMSIGSFLIEYKNEKILFDLGLGKNHFSSPEGNCDGGELLNNLQKAGLVRRDITKVIFSNFHPEHVGWTSMDINGKRFLTFNNADYYSSKNEWDFWKDKINEPIGIDPINFKEPLEGKIKFLKDGEEIIPNLFVRYEFGNTPGSINLILKAEGKRIWSILIYNLKILIGHIILIIMKKRLSKQKKVFWMICLKRIQLLLTGILLKKLSDIWKKKEKKNINLKDILINLKLLFRYISNI